METLSHTVGTVTVSPIQGNKGVPYKNPNDVEFIVKYPDGFTGNKIMPEGPVTISKEAAETFTNLGIGNVSSAESEASAPEPKDYSKLKKEELIVELNLRELAFDVKATKNDLAALLVANDAEKEGQQS